MHASATDPSRPASPDALPGAAPAATSAVPLDHAARLRLAVRETDYPITYFVLNPINRRLLRPLHRLGVAPTLVTVLSFVVALAAAACLWAAVSGALGGWVGWLGAALAMVSHQLDALDGDLARYSQRSSAFGAALDPILDRIGECAWIGAVVLGAPHDAILAQAGLASLSGILTYYYIVDGPVRAALSARVHQAERFAVTAKTAAGTRIKFGLFEPYTYGFPVAVALGWALPALWVVAAVFWATIAWQLVRLPGRLRTLS